MSPLQALGLAINTYFWVLPEKVRDFRLAYDELGPRSAEASLAFVFAACLCLLCFVVVSCRVARVYVQLPVFVAAAAA